MENERNPLDRVTFTVAFLCGPVEMRKVPEVSVELAPTSENSVSRVADRRVGNFITLTGFPPGGRLPAHSSVHSYSSDPTRQG